MLRRRDFVAFAAAIPALGAVPVRKVGKVEIAFKSPGPTPNGIQATQEGMWVIDQGAGNPAYLIDYTGKVLRKFETESDRASGITYENGTIWIASTYSREIIHADAMTGKTIQKYFTPGAGVIYRMVGDPPQGRSPLAAARSPQPQGQRPAAPRGGPQQLNTVGTGAHGMEWLDGKLWVAVPPSRTIYHIDPQTWIVQKKFASAANRPHGLGWEGKYLWNADSNLNGFFKHDPETGEIVEKIMLTSADPLPHGMTIWEGVMWYCDDTGVICRFKL